MAIPASQIVSVNPRVISAGGTDLEINGLILTHTDLIPASAPVMSFTSASSVGEYFGTDSAVYIAASKYFGGYANCFAYPTHLMIGKRIDSDTGAAIIGGAYSGKLGDLTAITDGSLTVTHNGTDYTIENIDLSTATSYSEAASLIQTAISASIEGTVVTYSSLTSGFMVSFAYQADTDNSAAITGDLAETLALTAENGATISDGTPALSIADNFTAIREQSDNWVTFTTDWAVDADEAVEYANWAADQGVQYLYVCWSMDADLLNQTDTTSIAYTLSENNADSVTLVYGDLDYAAFIMGCAASIDWNRNQGVITFAFKSQDGLAATVTSEAKADILLNKTCNFYGNYAARNDDYDFLYNGSMFGDYSYIDPYINAVWLNNAIQVALMKGLTSVGRTPYTDAGYTLIRAWMTDPITRAVRNGVIDAGVTLSESQKAQIYQEVGKDISDELYANGYVIVIEDAGASVRVNRESPNISLYYSYGGSCNKLVINSSALL